MQDLPTPILTIFREFWASRNIAQRTCIADYNKFLKRVVVLHGLVKHDLPGQAVELGLDLLIDEEMSHSAFLIKYKWGRGDTS